MKRLNWAIAAVMAAISVLGFGASATASVVRQNVSRTESFIASNTTTVVGAKVFQNYIVTGDWLIVTEILNTSLPYYNVSAPSSLFQIYLLDTDNATIKAATTLKMWGHKPEAIYLGPAQTSGLTLGAEYKVKIQATYAGGPSSNYTLAAADWKGSDLAYLDQWCIATAYAMDASYSYNGTADLVQFAAGIGEVLSLEGGAIFDLGIPFLSRQRPSLFMASVVTPTTPAAQQLTPDFDTNTDFATQVGPVIDADVTSVGAVLGLTGQQFAGFAIGILAVFIGMFVFSKAQSFGTAGALLVALAIGGTAIYFGNYIRAIGIQLTTGVLLVLAIMFVYKRWWSST